MNNETIKTEQINITKNEEKIFSPFMSNVVDTEKKEKNNSKEIILEVALKLFYEKGYEGTAISEICQLSKITKPTLYYFFKNKEGLYEAVWSKNYSVLIDKVRNVAEYKPNVNNYEKDVYPILVNIAKVIINFAKENVQMYFHSLSVIEMQDILESVKVANKYWKELYQIVMNTFIEMAKAHGGMKNREFQLTITFIGLINSYLSCWKMKSDNVFVLSPDQLVKQFMHGIFS